MAAGLALVVAAAPAPAYPDRPAPAHTGGFGEPTCVACHFDGELNPPGGELRVEGWPARPNAGRAYRLTVRLERPDMQRAGFQLAVRSADGAQAGDLESTDSRTAVTDTAGVRYVHHSAEGSVPTGAGVAEWSLTWTAPSAGAPLRLHVAANAANGDASAFGDAIYADSLWSDD